LTDFLALWIPFYYLLKIIFLIYLFHPSTQGAKQIYDVIIEPFLSKYEEQIDKALGADSSTNESNTRKKSS